MLIQQGFLYQNGNIIFNYLVTNITEESIDNAFKNCGYRSK